MDEKLKINSEIKHLNNAIKKLAKEDYDVWTNDVHYQGYGFNVILEKSWIDVYVSMNYGGKDSVFITKLERKNNVLDKFSAKELAREKTDDFSKIYDIVKKQIGNER